MNDKQDNSRGVQPQGAPSGNANPVATGLVTMVIRGGCKVRSGGQTLDCVVRNASKPDSWQSIAVGDEVEFSKAGGGACVLKSVRPRRNALSKTDPEHPGSERAIAANIDLAVLVVSMAEPPLKVRLIDRFLVAARVGGVKPVLCVNKIDLLSDDDSSPELAEVRSYEDLGVPIILCSTVTGRGIDRLAAIMRGKRSVLVGQSGVGKTSLINSINKGLRLPTAPLRRDGSKGRFTTSHTALVEPEPSMEIIDTPGLKDFGVREMRAEELQEYFPDFRVPATKCAYADCTHTSEPDCGVKLAVRDELIRRSRYESYLKLLGATAGEAVGSPRRGDKSRGSSRRADEVDEGPFKCAKCGTYVVPEDAGTEHRNHCPNCLYSLHLDNKPGDRAAYCGGLMEPIAVWVRHGGEWALIHRCQECGALSSNRTAADDNEIMLLSVAVRPLASPPFPLERLNDLRRRDG